MSRSGYPIIVGDEPPPLPNQEPPYDIVDMIKAIPPTPPTYNPDVASLFTAPKEVGIARAKIMYDSINGKIVFVFEDIYGDRLVASGTPFSASVVEVDPSGKPKTATTYNPQGVSFVPFLAYFHAVAMMVAPTVLASGMPLSTSPEPFIPVQLMGVYKPFDKVYNLIKSKLGDLVLYVAKQA